MKRRMGWILGALLPVALLAQGEEALTLDQCKDIALNRNSELVQSRLQLKMTSRDEISAFSNFLPSVSGSMGYNHSVAGPSSALRIDPQSGILVPVRDEKVKSWSSSAGLNARQMLFDGSAIFGFAQAAYQKGSANASAEATRQSVILQVKEAYHNLLKKEKLLQAQEQTLKQWDESYKRYETMYQVGKVPRSDVLKAKVQLENARLALIQAQSDLTIANASLNHVLGFSVDRKIKAIDNLTPVEEDISYEAALEKARASHPALRKSRSDVKASKAAFLSTSSQFLPSLYGSGGYSWNNEKFDQVKNMFDTDYNWYLGVSLSMPIFQGFSRIAGVSRSHLQVQSTKEALAQTERDVALSLHQAYASVQQARQQIMVTKDSEAAAEEDLRLNQEKYDLGSGTMLELITAQAAFTTARNAAIQARYDYMTAVAQLQKAMGVLN
ncbi:MAG: TolC family protein [bacterium]|nr:TolC family protein [bacterium]